jgi:hypothetical protein
MINHGLLPLEKRTGKNTNIEIHMMLASYAQFLMFMPYAGHRGRHKGNKDKVQLPS